MIRFIDMSMCAWIKEAFPEKDCEVFWGPPDQSRQTLARLMQKKDEEKTMGIPGLTVFRTGCRRNRDHMSLPQASRGWRAGNSEAGKFEMARTIPVVAEYTVVGWARNAIDANEIEKRLWFLEIYNPVEFTLECKGPDEEDVSIDLKMPVVGEDPIYGREVDEKTGRINWYSVTKIFTVDSFWLVSREDPFIGQIDVTYQQITSGDPITFDVVSIKPKS